MQRGKSKTTYAEIPDDAISSGLKYGITKGKDLFLCPWL